MGKLYKVCTTIHSLVYANIDNKYVYTNPQVVIWLQDRAKTIDCYKAQMVNQACS